MYALLTSIHPFADIISENKYSTHVMKLGIGVYNQFPGEFHSHF